MALRKGGVWYRFARQTSLLAVACVVSLTVLLGTSAHALSDVNYHPQAVGEGWSIYNEGPSAGYTLESFGGRDGTLAVGVNTSLASDSQGRLEGLQRTVVSGKTVKVSLYVDNAWGSTDVRTGFGIKGKTDGNVVSADIRIEFIRSPSFTGWRIGSDASGWTNVADSYSQGAWNEIEFAINNENREVEAYINGVRVNYLDTRFAAHLSDATVSNYNFGAVGENYTSHWSKLEVGQYDSVAPTISFLAPAGNDDVMKGSDYVSVFASDETMLRQVGIAVYNVDGELVRENAPFLTGTDCRLDVSLVGLEDGWYRIDAYAVDGASHQSQLLSRSFAIDSSSPEITISSPLKDVVSGVVSIEGSVSDAHLSWHYLAIKNAEGVTVAGPEQVSGGMVSGWQWNTTDFSDGVYTIVLAAEDAAGNRREKTKEVRVDNTAPVVTLDAFDTNVAAGGMTIFSGDIDDVFAQLVLSIDGSKYRVVEIQNGRWSHAFVNGLTAGHHVVSVIATDSEGNFSLVHSTREVAAMGSGGSGVLPVKPYIDTAQLFQTASNVEPRQMTVARNEIDVLGAQSTQLTSGGETASPSVALEPTENGWKFLGILWYWWVISSLLVTAISWYVVMRWRRPGIEAVTD